MEVQLFDPTKIEQDGNILKLGDSVFFTEEWKTAGVTLLFQQGILSEICRFKSGTPIDTIKGVIWGWDLGYQQGEKDCREEIRNQLDRFLSDEETE